MRIGANERVSLATSTRILELVGDDELEGAVVEGPDGVVRTLPARAVFALLGAEPRNGWMPDTIERDEHGFVLTGERVSASARGSAQWVGRMAASLETSVPGVFAAGTSARVRLSASPPPSGKARRPPGSCANG